jgi:hypothetical protein
MNNNKQFNTWQDLLKVIIRNPQERQRIAHKTHVNPLTLIRWSNNESQPRHENIRLLLNAIPYEYVEQFLHLLTKDFPEFEYNHASGHEIATHPLPEFYARVLNAYAHTPPALLPQSLFDLILQQVLAQLDPKRQGMSVSIVSCVDPLDGRIVRSLREIAGIGSSPWRRDLGQSTIFLGLESLAGSAVNSGRTVSAKNREDKFSLTSVHWVEYEQSAVAAPISRHTDIAGSLVVSSAHPEHFTPEDETLVEHYAHLISLGFEHEQFYPSSRIQLHMMPPYKDQIPYFQDFHKRIQRKFAEGMHAHEDITLFKAQTLVWQEIEEDLLRLFLNSES